MLWELHVRLLRCALSLTGCWLPSARIKCAGMHPGSREHLRRAQEQWAGVRAAHMPWQRQGCRTSARDETDTDTGCRKLLLHEVERKGVP